MIDIQEVLKIEMKSRSLSYADIAKATGKTTQAVWDKLNARSTPSFAGIAMIAAAMDLRLIIRRKDGAPLDFDAEKLLGAVELTEIAYSDLERILDAMNLEIALCVTP